MVVQKTKKRSLILKYFTKDIYIELLRITKIPEADNNLKGRLIKKLLRENNIPFEGLGSGTNRMAVLIEGYAVKIALDFDGCVDNRREMLYTRQLQPYVIKVYECMPSGLVAVCEFVEIFTLSEYHQYQDEMANILSEITKNFLVGDCGISGKNYVNWGTRNDGTICILDFAYIYSVKYNVFGCKCDDTAILKFDKNFVNLICPLCGRKYTFGEVRRRITKADQEKEIGDIRRLGYNITKPEQVVDVIPEFENHETKIKKAKSDTEKLIAAYRKGKLKPKKPIQDWDYPESQQNNNI